MEKTLLLLKTQLNSKIIHKEKTNLLKFQTDWFFLYLLFVFKNLQGICNTFSQKQAFFCKNQQKIMLKYGIFMVEQAQKKP